VTAIEHDPAVTVRLTEPEAISNVRIVLELCASGRLRCSEKTRRPTATSVTGLALLLAAGEFYPHEPIAAYAWPLLVQAGSLRGHDVHHPTPERVRLDPLDREAVQVQQTRRVRHRIPMNMLNLRRLEQARDLTSIMKLS
jgi:hypothetical protein